jgi:vancomycin aglycone glucosyltransferase
MRVLLSTIGSRGDVQPLLALARQLGELGHEARLCAPPDFRELAAGVGVAFVPIGPEVRTAAAAGEEAKRQAVPDLIANQFTTLGETARDCDVLVSFGPLQVAARSVAELRGIPYHFAAFCPTTLPSGHHAPAPLPGRPAAGSADNRTLWAQDAEFWQATFGAAVNAQRSAAGMAAVASVRDHMFTDRPLLAADPTLAPWPTPSDLAVLQTGAWILADERPLPADLAAFLDAGEPPIYFGFGSMRSPQETSRVMVDAARELGYRAIVLRGWADLSLVDNAPDCFSIEEANLQALFPRVAAIVYHGGSGTTTIATRAGTPQVVVPHMYDQHYFASRIDELGIGVAHQGPEPTVDSLTTALTSALRRETVARALATAVQTDGATIAAKHVTAH